MRRLLKRAIHLLAQLPVGPIGWRLPLLARTANPRQAGRIRLGVWQVEYLDLHSVFVEHKDIIRQGIYRFSAGDQAPVILDGGSHIGISVLDFKAAHPAARITCFEPEERAFAALEANVRANGLDEIELVRAGLAAEPGQAMFVTDGDDGSAIGAHGTRTIATVRLSDHIHGRVDYLKLNIEGQELPVLEEVEASGKLAQVREIALEYHGWHADSQQRLGRILELLDRNGFRYRIHDLDARTNPATKPPIRWDPPADWFCIVYARNERMLD